MLEIDGLYEKNRKGEEGDLENESYAIIATDRIFGDVLVVSNILGQILGLYYYCCICTLPSPHSPPLADTSPFLSMSGFFSSLLSFMM